MMNPPTKTGDIPTKAEFMIILEWDEDSGADIDLWIQRDEEAPVGYKNKESAVLHLERDDLGHSSDTVMINGESKVVKINREVITVRGLVPGDYYVGVHYYREPAVSHYEEKVNGVPQPDSTVRGTVTFADVNPYKEVWAQEFVIDEEGTHVNMPAVTVDDTGTVTQIFKHMRNLGPKVSDANDSPANYTYGNN